MKPRTVKVRIAVAVDDGGNVSCWPISDTFTEGEAFEECACGITGNYSRYIVTAELPLPEVATVEGAVEDGT